MSKTLVIDKYKLYTDKGLDINETKKIMQIADLHVGKNTLNKYGEESIQLLEKYLEDTNNIDSIIVPGDLVNGANSYLNSEYLARKRIADFRGWNDTTNQKFYDFIDENAVKLISDLCEQYNIIKLVISSSWRLSTLEKTINDFSSAS